MDIGPIFFKEICFTISLKNGPNPCSINELRFGKEKSRNRFFLPKAGPMSILQKSRTKKSGLGDEGREYHASFRTKCIAFRGGAVVL
jgi:hypothetical protein